MRTKTLPSMTPTGWFQIAWSADVAVADVVPLHFSGAISLCSESSAVKSRCSTPHVDGVVEFGHRVRPHPPCPVGPVLIGDADVASVAIPHPAVKRALDPVCDDTAAMREAGAEVLAMRHLDRFESSSACGAKRVVAALADVGTEDFEGVRRLPQGRPPDEVVPAPATR